MLKPAATLEEGGHQATRQPASYQNAKPEGAVMRFAYATGSQPLDGYTIKRGIGVGGFGEVYFAVTDAGKEVALKRIQRNLDVELRGVRQCLNLKHAHLIALYDIKYDAEGQAWVIMEYVSGESLKDVLDRNPHGLPPQEVRQWFDGLAAGVACLHDHGIVHRDLKPGNIFIDGDTVKIGDYGLSKYISCSRRSGQTESVGTFHYMAPEIGRGVYGKEIDVYALGIILFEMLTGRVPFEGESSQEIIMKHLTAEPDLACVPEPYRQVIRRALFKDPAKRYANVAEMLAGLNSAGRVADDKSPQAKPPVRGAATTASPYYIGEPLDTDGMYFGPVKDVIPAEIVSPHEFRPASASQPEPIATAVGDAWRQGRGWWRTTKLNPTAKLAVLLVSIFVLIANSHWLIPAVTAIGCVYLIYFGIRAIVLATQPTPAPVAVAVATASAATPTRANGPRYPDRRRRWQDAARQILWTKSYGDRMGELIGAMLMSAGINAVLCLLMLIAAGKPLDRSIETWTFYAWFTLSSIAGSWLVLTVCKFWEGRDGEAFRRRFVLLIAGLALGLFAFSLTGFLDIRLTHDLVVRSPLKSIAPMSFYAPDGSLKLPAFLVYFAAVMALPRWWRQVDPLRNNRLSLWAVAMCALCAWICHMFWPFPQPWGFLLAAAISVAVQLSSPWITTAERSTLREQLHHA